MLAFELPPELACGRGPVAQSTRPRSSLSREAAGVSRRVAREPGKPFPRPARDEEDHLVSLTWFQRGTSSTDRTCPALTAMPIFKYITDISIKEDRQRGVACFQRLRPSTQPTTRLITPRWSGA